MIAAADKSKCEVIARQAKAICKYAKERYEASNLGSDMRYVNVAGGSKIGEGQYSEELDVARHWLEQQGFGRYTSMVPGPLVRATLGKALTHMPLATGSTYTHLSSAMKEAYEISKGMREPDLELDLQGAKEPKFGNHSLRRHADKVARESVPKHHAEGCMEVTKNLIDYFFGWLLKEMTKDMQMHYAGLDRPSRRLLARVTKFL